MRETTSHYLDLTAFHENLVRLMETGPFPINTSSGETVEFNHGYVAEKLQSLSQMGYDWLGRPLTRLSADATDAVTTAQDIVLRNRPGHRPSE